jgi:organic radical activating enzyme
MKKLSTLVLLLLIIAVAVFAGSPYYSAYQLKNAYDAKDGASIAAAIDYQQLRPTMQSQLTTKFAATLSQYPLVAELGGEPLQQAANEFIGQAVDGAITAQNIEKLINTQGQANTATKELAAAWAIASNQVDLKNLIQDMIIQRGDIDAVVKNQMQQIMAKQADELEQQAAQGVDSAKPTLSYCGINCFTISGQVKGYPITIEMQRQGFIDWKIVDVILP